MNPNSRIIRLVSLRFLVVVVLGVAVVGCGGPSRLAPVDVSKARQALKTTLESWKDGKSPDELKNSASSITAQDFDWLGGCQLVSFEIAASDRTDDANLHCPVRLRIKKTNDEEVEKDVTYVVTTSPVTTVFREVMM
jgi:hypothetical protein